MSSNNSTNEQPGKLPKSLAFPFLIAAKAAVLDVPPWCRSSPASWWAIEGQRWLDDLCRKLEISADALPAAPAPTDIARLSSTFPPSSHRDVVLTVLSLCLLPNSRTETGSTPPLYYLASDRVFFNHTLTLLSIPYTQLLDAEDHVSRGLYHQVKRMEMEARAEAARKEQEEGWGGRWGRWAATAGGIILGGVAFGLTSGLAAPALLPLLPFLTAGSAPIVVGTLFGLTGGGLAGRRVNKRWAGVDKFEFLQVVGGGEPTDPDAITNGNEGGALERAQVPSLLATIVVPGISLASEDDGVDAVRRCADLFTSPRRDAFVLSHSPSTMLSTGKALHDWVTNKILGKLKGEIIKRTALQVVFGVVALPMTVYQTTGMVIDNEWVRGTERARKAGKLLAEVLQAKAQGERPVVLVGVSLGALVVFEALQTLASTNGTPISPLVDSAIMVSLPIAPSPSEWKAVRSAVGRRLVNGYCKTDFVLACVGRLHEVLGGARILNDMAGLEPVDEDGELGSGVENVDLGGVVAGHFDLNDRMEAIFERVGVSN